MAVKGLKWHYDVTGAEPIVRDLRIYNSGALLAGTAMAYGPVATAENTGCAIVADSNVLSNIIGVLNQDVASADALGVVATGVDKYAKIIINPFAVYLGKYSTHIDDDVPTTAADSSGKSATVTQVTDHERAWVYNKTNGNLFQVGATTSTTVLTAATSYDDNLSATGSGDLMMVLPCPYSADKAGGSIDLSEASGQVSMQLAGYNATAGAGSGIILENYITSSSRPMEPLVCAKHSGYEYSSEAPEFYGDVMFSEHLLAAGGVVNTRVIN